MADFETLKGKVIIQIKGSVGSEEIIIKTSDGSEYKMYHNQECCESVEVIDIDGDLQELIGKEILLAEKVESGDGDLPSDYYEDYENLWTFYKLSTIDTSVTIRWLGSSNGYYSVSVSFEEVE